MDQVFPGVWASNTLGRAKNASPVQVKLKEGKQPARLKQYYLKKEARRGIRPIIETFLQIGLLKECQSDFNTSILPVKKLDGSYRLVQDLRAVNKITEDLYSVVANPYILLTCLTPELTWFTVLDLKDAFFCLPLHRDSQKILAFEWENPKTGCKTELTWMVLPQGFKNSPTIFREPLARHLESREASSEEGKLEDVAVCGRSLDSYSNPRGVYKLDSKPPELFRFTSVSSISKEGSNGETAMYLGYEISAGQRTLGQGRKETICQTPKP